MNSRCICWAFAGGNLLPGWRGRQNDGMSQRTSTHSPLINVCVCVFKREGFVCIPANMNNQSCVESIFPVFFLVVLLVVSGVSVSSTEKISLAVRPSCSVFPDLRSVWQLSCLLLAVFSFTKQLLGTSYPGIYSLSVHFKRVDIRRTSRQRSWCSCLLSSLAEIQTRIRFFRYVPSKFHKLADECCFIDILC